jgi:hypothetical protein
MLIATAMGAERRHALDGLATLSAIRKFSTHAVLMVVEWF